MLCLKNVWIWQGLSLLSILLFGIQGATLWGCETGHSQGTLNCLFGDLDSKVAETKTGYGKLFSSSYQRPQQDHGYHHGGGGYSRPSYGHMSYRKPQWNSYKPRRMHYRPMKRMYSYPAHRHGYHNQGWKPKQYHRYSHHNKWSPPKKKKDVKIQIVVHCPSEHPLCKTSHGKSHRSYEKSWKPRKQHYSYSPKPHYQNHYGWQKRSYKPRHPTYTPKKWDERKWQEAYDHDENKYCDCKEGPKHYHDDNGYKIEHRVVYHHDSHGAQYGPSHTYDDYTGVPANVKASVGQQQIPQSLSADFNDELESENAYMSEPDGMDLDNSLDPFLVVKATPPPYLDQNVAPPTDLVDEENDIDLDLETRFEKSLPLALSISDNVSNKASSGNEYETEEANNVSSSSLSDWDSVKSTTAQPPVMDTSNEEVEDENKENID